MSLEVYAYHGNCLKVKVSSETEEKIIEKAINNGFRTMEARTGFIYVTGSSFQKRILNETNEIEKENVIFPKDLFPDAEEIEDISLVYLSR